MTPNAAIDLIVLGGIFALLSLGLYHFELQSDVLTIGGGLTSACLCLVSGFWGLTRRTGRLAARISMFLVAVFCVVRTIIAVVDWAQGAERIEPIMAGILTLFSIGLLVKLIREQPQSAK